MKIGFIGTGVMGTGIILNLLKAGFPVTVYNRTKAHADTVLAAGATWSNSPKAVAARCGVIFTMVGFPADVERVYFDADGVLAGAAADSILVDMTTSTPALAKTIAKAASAHGCQALDAPVSGGDVGAKNGTLTMMAGGDAATIDFLQPVFTAFTAQVTRFGGAGQGQFAKAANQIMVAGTMTGLTEMLVFAQAAGLNRQQVIDTVAGGAGDNWSLRNYGPRILAEDYTPGFFVKHFVKDLRIALEAAADMGLDLPATATAKRVYESLVKAGQGELGTQALLLAYGQNKKA